MVRRRDSRRPLANVDRIETFLRTETVAVRQGVDGETEFRGINIFTAVQHHTATA